MEDGRRGSRSVALIGVPYDGASSFQRGAASGPQHIRAALRSEATNWWTESLIDLGEGDTLQDVGDVDVADPELIRPRIEAGMAAALCDGRAAIALGGDHSVTYPLVRGTRIRYPKLSLLHFDAHPDLYDRFEGNPYSHASPFARIMEEGLVSRLVQVGIRTINAHQRRQADRFGVEVITMRDWSDRITLAFKAPLYVSVDLDALDPAFAPGVAHREPGGFSVRELLTVIQRLDATVIAADVVELVAANDPAGITASVGAKIVKELAARMLGGALQTTARPGAQKGKDDVRRVGRRGATKPR